MTTQSTNKYFSSKTSVCTRCGGEGKLPSFAHVLGGNCFKCGGAGSVVKESFKNLPAPLYEHWFIEKRDLGNGTMGEFSVTKLYRSEAMAIAAKEVKGGSIRKETKYSHALVRKIKALAHLEYYANLLN